MIIYFTGTGNSRYLAGRMARQLRDTAVDGASLIKSGETPEFFSETPYVFVAPVYAWRLPKVFERWLGKCRFGGNKKAYFVINCGSEIGAAGGYARKLAESLGLDYMGSAQVVMPENYLIMFTPTAPEEDEDIISAATEVLGGICGKISSEVPLERVKAGLLGHIYSDIVNPCFYTFYIGAGKFRVTDGCISCGICADNCMLNNISIKDGRPVWGSDCTHCLACICKCPTEAIEYGRQTKGRRRYVCPKEE